MKNLLVALFAIMSFSLSAQGFRSIGVEASGIVVEQISSSGVNGTNHSFGLNLEFEACDLLSFVLGAKYNKYGSHIHYTIPPNNDESPVGEMIQKSQYKINSFAIPLTAKINTKYFSFQFGAQGDMMIYQSPEVYFLPLPREDLDFENYAQSDLRKFNVSAIAGIQFKRMFGDNIEMFARPSAQYFFKPFYTNGGFKDVNMAYSFTVGANYLLGVHHN